MESDDGAPMIGAPDTALVGPPPATPPSSALASAVLLLALAVAGCAPHLVRVTELAPALREERYRLALAEREARGAAVEAQLVLWAEVPAASRLPGAEGRLLLAAPDAFRLRVGSLFGTALDLGARGDSLSAYVPSRRKGLTLDARRDSLGILRPGGLAFRALSAAWRPPDSAWPAAAWRDTLLRIWWLEDADTLAVEVGSNGLPASATLTRPAGGGVQVTYRAWDRSAGPAWPALLDFEDRKGGFRLTCKVARVRFPARPDSLRLVVPIPAGAERLTLAGLRRALERLGGL
jgi:hypothetical protein